MTDPVLTWADVLSDNGTPADHPVKADGYRSRDNGIYPVLPRGFSWYLGGESYMGDPSRLPANGRIPTCSAMTAFHLFYPEAVSAGGAAKPSIVGSGNSAGVNVIIRKYKSWVHKKAGGWIEVQSAPSDKIVTGRFDQAQTGNQATTLTTISNADGSFTDPAPAPGWCNHGWINSRGSFPAGTVDGAFSYFEARADKPNANLLVASGIDWWQSPSAPFPQNTGYSMSAWKRLTTDFQIVTGTSLSEAIMRADPPPPLAGLVSQPPAPPVEPAPPPVAPSFSILINGKPLPAGSEVSFRIG
jgi:hypothetical protein